MIVNGGSCSSEEDWFDVLRKESLCLFGGSHPPQYPPVCKTRKWLRGEILKHVPYSCEPDPASVKSKQFVLRASGFP